MAISTPSTAHEARLRRLAARQGLLLRKSEPDRLRVDDFGLYQLYDPQRRAVVAGIRYDLDLSEVEAVLTAAPARA